MNVRPAKLPSPGNTQSTSRWRQSGWTNPPILISVPILKNLRTSGLFQVYAVSEGALVLAPLPVVAGLPVLHSGTAPQAGRASPKSGPSGQWPDFDTPRAITGNPSQKSRAFLHPHLAPLTPVSLTSPSDGATTNTTPVFQWERVSGAEAYLVLVSSASNPNDLMWVGYTRGADTTSVTYGAAANTLGGAPARPLVSGVSYTWGVMAASLQPDLPASDPLDLTGYEPEAWAVSASPVRGFAVE